jgi:hypothetical protein
VGGGGRCEREHPLPPLLASMKMRTRVLFLAVGLSICLIAAVVVVMRASQRTDVRPRVAGQDKRNSAVADHVDAGNSPHPERVIAGFQPWQEGNPFVTGDQFAGIAQAEAKAGFDFVRPSSSLANDDLVVGTFVEIIPGDPTDPEPCGQAGVRHAAIEYSTGMLLIVDLVSGTGCPFDKDPSSVYQSMVGAQANWKLQTINGVLALTSPGDPAVSAPAFVDLVVKGERVRLFAEHQKVDLAALIVVAGSVK